MSVNAASLASAAANLSAKAAGESKPSDAQAAARQFEALFVKQLLSQVKISGGLGGAQSGAQSDMINSMWRDQISKQISQSGGGLGLSQVIASQLDGSADSRFDASRPLVDLRTQANAGFGLNAQPNYLSDPPAFTDADEFVTALKPHIEQAANELGVSPRVLLAQAALETGWGRHMPVDSDGRASYNLFGIKADASWKGAVALGQTQEYDGQRMVSTEDGFRRYDSYAQSVRDYVDFIRSQPRYAAALNHGGDDKNFVQGLKSGGYATDPQYVDKVFDVARGETLSQHWDAI